VLNRWHVYVLLSLVLKGHLGDSNSAIDGLFGGEEDAMLPLAVCTTVTLKLLTVECKAPLMFQGGIPTTPEKSHCRFHGRLDARLRPLNNAIRTAK